MFVLRRFLPPRLRRLITSRRELRAQDLDSLRREFLEFYGQFSEHHSRWQGRQDLEHRIKGLQCREEMRRVIARLDEEFPEWRKKPSTIAEKMESANRIDFAHNGAREPTLAAQES